MNTHSGDQMPYWVSIDDPFDNRLNLRLQDLEWNGTPRVQMILPCLKPEQPFALTPTVANRHAQAPNVRLKPVIGILPHFHIRLVLIEPPDYLWSEIGHRPWSVSSLQ